MEKMIDHNEDAELKAMQEIASAMRALGDDKAATIRVVRWVVDRYARSTTPVSSAAEGAPAPGMNLISSSDDTPRFSDLGELYAEANPQTEADRALVVGYWYQFVEGQPDFAAFTINKALRDLGYPVGNITNAIGALGTKHPKLAIQLKKAGTSKQARKTYKLTAAGKAAVEGMIRQQ